MTSTFQLCICSKYKWWKTTEPFLTIFYTVYSKRPLSVNDFLWEAVICVWAWVLSVWNQPREVTLSAAQFPSEKTGQAFCLWNPGTTKASNDAWVWVWSAVSFWAKLITVEVSFLLGRPVLQIVLASQSFLFPGDHSEGGRKHFLVIYVLGIDGYFTYIHLIPLILVEFRLFHQLLEIKTSTHILPPCPQTY